MLKHQILTLTLLISAGVLVTACSKKTEAPAQAESAAAPATAEAPAPASSAAAEADQELAKKREAMEFALAEDAIKNDRQGQHNLFQRFGKHG